MYLKRFLNTSRYFGILLIFICCSPKPLGYTITVTNTTDLIRKNESIEISLDQLQNLSAEKISTLILTDSNNNRVKTQLVKSNSDETSDYLLFQADSLQAGETRNFTILFDSKEDEVEVKDTIRTHSRFVPERIDDFAWENDKVAFRTYGPKCQELSEKGDPSGLISSGIDCWLKRVDYPIVDRWYKNALNGKSYHVDHGEGLDNYHVGTTRGCGGTALICDGEQILSKNFTAWKVIANGPIRSIFELTYAPISVCGEEVIEKKRISIDLGTEFYQCDVRYESKTELTEGFVGIALHKGTGEIKANSKEGWLSYWEPMGDSYLGTAILLDPNTIIKNKLDPTINENERFNNTGTHLKITNNSFRYRAGFGWKKRGDYISAQDWQQHLVEESIKNSNPIQIKIIKN